MKSPVNPRKACQRLKGRNAEVFAGSIQYEALSARGASQSRGRQHHSPELCGWSKGRKAPRATSGSSTVSRNLYARPWWGLAYWVGRRAPACLRRARWDEWAIVHLALLLDRLPLCTDDFGARVDQLGPATGARNGC